MSAMVGFRAKEPSQTAYVVRLVAMMVGAVAINLSLGTLVRRVVHWPLFLDSFGTVVVGALLSSLAGAATGALTNLLWAAVLGDPNISAYAVTAAFIGWAAGYAAWRGAFQRFGTVVLAGFLTGIGASLISAPITAYLFSGVSGSGG